MGFKPSEQSVQIWDANQSEILFTVSQKEDRVLYRRGMIEDSSGMRVRCLRRFVLREDVQAYLDKHYYVQRNRATKKFWNQPNNSESLSEKTATAFAEAKDNTDRLEWLLVLNGTVVEPEKK